MAKTVDEENTIFLTRVRFLKRTLVICFIFLLGWWMFLQFGGYGVGQHFLWGNFYQLIAILGLIGGFIISQYFFKWENKEIDLIGKSIQFFSIGLLFQIFGQNVYDFYVITLKNFIPYPSIADVGFFGSILFYISALITLARVKNVSLSFSSLNRKILIVLIPAILLSISYFFFLKEYHFNGNNPIKVFLDFAYPLGEVIYVSLAFLILFFGKNLDGTLYYICVLTSYCLLQS